MKLNKLIYPLALALAVTLGATGCHNHKAGKITQLPEAAPVVGTWSGHQRCRLTEQFLSRR